MATYSYGAGDISREPTFCFGEEPNLLLVSPFEDYDSPKTALAVWEDYIPDLGRLGLLKEGARILEACSDSTSLDFALFRLTSANDSILSGRRHTPEIPQEDEENQR